MVLLRFVRQRGLLPQGRLLLTGDADRLGVWAIDGQDPDKRVIRGLLKLEGAGRGDLFCESKVNRILDAGASGSR